MSTWRYDMAGEGESGNAASTRLLVVEDDPTVRRLIGILLAEFPVHIIETASAAAALQACAVQAPALALIDMGLPDRSGAELCAEIRRLYPDTAVCMVSGATGAYERQQARDAGCAAYLVKPFASRELKTLVPGCWRFPQDEDTNSSATAGRRFPRSDAIHSPDSGVS